MKPKNISVPRRQTSPASGWMAKIGSFSLIAGAAAVTGQSHEALGLGSPGGEVSFRPPERRSESLRRAAGENFSRSALLQRQSRFRLPSRKATSNDPALLAGADNCPGLVIPAGTYTAAAPFTDSGNTTGANHTISEYGYYSPAYGPDHIYTFTIQSLGPDPKIEVSTTSATYNVATYILNGLTFGRCPAGTDNFFWWDAVASATAAPAGATETISAAAMRGLPLNVPLHLFVDSQTSAAANNAGPYTIRLQDVTLMDTPAAPPIDAPLDLSGDGKTDLSIVRTTAGQMTWYTRTSGDQFLTPQNWGVEGDRPVPADYDGDGRDDIAVWRPGPQGLFYIIGSRDQTFRVVAFGQTGDDPSVVADYTGDGADDLAVYRAGAAPGAQSFWYYRPLTSPGGVFVTIPWGQHGDTPMPGDVTFDSGADFTVRRAEGGFGRFYVRAPWGTWSFVFGLASDMLVPASYAYIPNVTQPAVVRAGPDGFLHWYIRESSWTWSDTPYHHRVWGVAATDIPAPGDYDGDGQGELSVWRPGQQGTFFSKTMFTDEISVRQWGQTGDMPTASFRNH